MSASGGMQQAQCRTPPSLPPIRQRSASPIQTDMLWGADGLMSPVRVTPSRSISKFTNRPYVRGWAHALFVFLMAALIRRSFSGYKSAEHFYGGGRKGGRGSTKDSLVVLPTAIDPVLVSYSYFEKDSVQLENFEFFMQVGMGMGASSYFEQPRNTDFTIVVSGSDCTPCVALKPPKLNTMQALPSSRLRDGITEAWAGPGLTLLYRSKNEGMDIAAHNTTLQWHAANSKRVYKYFIFLNSSIRGPFLPSYVPVGFQWTQAFTNRLSDSIKVVASSLVCLPELDAGGYGPKAESWAFATDSQGLEILQEAGTFGTRECKLCDDGIVVKGEYGITNALLSKGFNIATLMSRYANGTDWRDKKHWGCNNNVHPSRSGTYDAITMHPFETVFLKASWHVGEPFTSHYTRWFMRHAQGKAGTQGKFDEAMYRYGVSPIAQEAREREQCYRPNT